MVDQDVASQADSVSHLYMYLNQNDTSDSDPFDNTAWFEDGYYVGAGAGSAPINVSTPHFFRTYSYAGTGYHEGDDGSTPAGAIPYELLYAGYNYSLGSYDWQYYYANLSTPRDTIHMKNFPSPGHLQVARWVRPIRWVSRCERVACLRSRLRVATACGGTGRLSLRRRYAPTQGLGILSRVLTKTSRSRATLRE
jgi:hypothetical protein